MTDHLETDVMTECTDMPTENSGTVPDCCAPGRAAFLMTPPATPEEQK